MSQVLSSRSPSFVDRTLSPFEFWPGWMFYTPVVLYWLAMGVRYRSFCLPTAANPHVETGGLCGESKSSILDQVQPAQRRWIAPYIKVTVGHVDEDLLRRRLAAEHITFPLVAKPDIGCHGDGVRLVHRPEQLAQALLLYPKDSVVLLQKLIDHPGEAGVFYVKVPGQPARITSLTLKHAPFVTGNGRSTLRELILAGERTREIADLYFGRLAGKLDDVLAAGEAFRLVFTGNHCKGSVFRDGRAEITSPLTRRIDEICGSMPDFHFGRVDLRFRDTASLRRGEDFSIIEINGVGSEATHIWDPSTTLVDAYRTQFEHYGLAFRIGDQMRRSGHRPSSPLALLRAWRRQSRMLASYPISD